MMIYFCTKFVTKYITKNKYNIMKKTKGEGGVEKSLVVLWKKLVFIFLRVI